MSSQDPEWQLVSEVTAAAYLICLENDNHTANYLVLTKNKPLYLEVNKGVTRSALHYNLKLSHRNFILRRRSCALVVRDASLDLTSDLWPT